MLLQQKQEMTSKSSKILQRKLELQYIKNENFRRKKFRKCFLNVFVYAMKQLNIRKGTEKRYICMYLTYILCFL